jgi:dimethylaniline monooxygenase (N-oxide forming)
LLTGTVFLCKSSRALPYLSAKYRSKSLWNKIRSFLINVPLKDTGGRQIEVAAWPELIDDKGVVHFRGTSRKAEKQAAELTVRPDVVVFATGYTKSFPFLDKSYPLFEDANMRGVYSEDDVSIGYIGFLRPAIGTFRFSGRCC